MRCAKLGMKNKCPRCGGLMVDEYLIDYFTGERDLCLSCISCGNKVDPTILGHRLLAAILQSS